MQLDSGIEAQSPAFATANGLGEHLTHLADIGCFSRGGPTIEPLPSQRPMQKIVLWSRIVEATAEPAIMCCLDQQSMKAGAVAFDFREP